jgi:hypothetical protein
MPAPWVPVRRNASEDSTVHMAGPSHTGIALVGS